ncbi:MAG: PAS domain-containing protein, partial [Acidobacteria bacterium]|nr:PAS domain-containing protein [Acidobacteriota bacterium]
ALAAIELVRSSDPDLPVIIVTEPIGEDLAADLMRAGANDIVVTSRPARLPASVDREMRTARRRRQLRRALLEEHAEGVEESRDPAASPTRQDDPDSFRALAENSPDLIARFGPDLRRVYVNPAIERLTGLPAEKLTGRRLSEVNFDERYAGPIDKALLEAFALGAEGTLEVRLPGPGGERVYQLRIVPEHGPGGAVETVLVVSRDISALHRSEERMRDFIESALDAILTLDVNGRILEVNPALERMIGETAERVVGRKMAELAEPEHAAELTESLQQAASGGETSHISTSLRDATGSHIEIEATVARQSRRGAETLFVIARDVTERRRAAKELAEESRMAAVGRITTHVSHEFNNTLMGIQPFADALKRMSTEPKILEMAEHISRSVRRGRRASENLRAFTQPTPPSLATIDLPAWLADSVRELELMLPAGVRLAVETSELPPSLRGDARQLMQVLTNLIVNAIDALGSAGGSIRLAATAAHDPASPSAQRLLHLSVSDDGPGIPTEDLGYVFEPFFSTRLRGGLGLTTARQITEAHGGRISIESTPGHGTTVHVFIPLPAE